MHRQMSFLQLVAPPGAAPVWPSLRAAERAETIATLARLIAKAATHDPATHEKENVDD